MKFIYFNKKIIKKINTQILDFRDIDYLVNGFVTLNNCSEYLNKITYYSFDDKDTLSLYNYIDKSLLIDLENIIEAADILIDKENECYYSFVNLYILEDLFHELIHLYQYFQIGNFNNKITTLKKKQLGLLHNIKRDTYYKYYDLFIFEREALITSKKMILCYIKKYLKNDDLFEYYLDNLITTLKSGYEKDNDKLTYPLDTIYNNLFDANTPIIRNKNEYINLKYGLKIESNLFDDENNIKDIIIKNLK